MTNPKRWQTEYLQINRNSYENYNEASDGRRVKVNQAKQYHQTRHRVENVEPVPVLLFVLDDVWKSSLSGWLWRGLGWCCCLHVVVRRLWSLRGFVGGRWNCSWWRGERHLRLNKCIVLWGLQLLLLTHLVKRFWGLKKGHVLVHVLRVSLLHPRLHRILMSENAVGIARPTAVERVQIITGNVGRVWLLLLFQAWSCSRARHRRRTSLSQFTGAHAFWLYRTLIGADGCCRRLSRRVAVKLWLTASRFWCEHEMNCVSFLALVLPQDVFQNDRVVQQLPRIDEFLLFSALKRNKMHSLVSLGSSVNRVSVCFDWFSVTRDWVKVLESIASAK